MSYFQAEADKKKEADEARKAEEWFRIRIAAPKLLSALAMLIVVCENHDIDERDERYVAEARAAIAEARGTDA